MRVRRQPHLTLDDHFRAVATGTPLRDGHETDRAGLTLVDACRALLAAAPSQPVADAIFSRVDRAGLVDAVAAMERLARSPEDRARDLILTRRGAALPPAAAGHARLLRRRCRRADPRRPRRAAAHRPPATPDATGAAHRAHPAALAAAGRA